MNKKQRGRRKPIEIGKAQAMKEQAENWSKRK